MSDAGRVAMELDSLERIQGDLANIASRTDPGRRGELVELRRRLSQQILLIGQTTEPLFTDPAHRAEFRKHFSAMRSTAALHQAEWPAIRLGEDDDLYLKSALLVREKNRAFINWVRAALPLLGRNQ